MAIDTQCPTLNHRLVARSLATPNRTAFIFLRDGEKDEDSVTYAQLDRAARTIAASLRTVAQPGARVMLLYPSGLDYIAAFFGCLYAGVIAVPAYPPQGFRMRATLARLRAISEDCAPAAVLTTSAIAERRAAMAKEVPPLADVPWIVAGAHPEEGADASVDFSASPDTAAFIQYTSGSTATPKGVMLTHRNISANQRVIRDGMGSTERSICVGWLPLYHDMGLVGNVLHSVEVGMPCVLMSPFHFLQKPVRWLRAIARFRGTVSGGPDFAYALAVQKATPEDRATLDLSSWEVAFSGAEPVRASTLESFARFFELSGFKSNAFVPCYGLAESTLMVSSRPSDSPAVRMLEKESYESDRATPASPEKSGVALVSCGKIFGDSEVAIVNPESRTRVPPGRIGEIWVRGDSIAIGYWNRPVETEATFRAHLADEPNAGPFLRTGDLGFILEGELFVAGRQKDTIIVRGRKIHPQDIEETVERSSTTVQPSSVAAFGVPDVDGEAVAVVAAVSAAGAARGHEVVRDILKQIVELHDIQPQTIALVQPRTMMKTSSGKLRRSAMRSALIDGSLELLERWNRP